MGEGRILFRICKIHHFCTGKDLNGYITYVPHLQQIIFAMLISADYNLQMDVQPNRQVDDLIEAITVIYNRDYPKFARKQDFLSFKLYPK
jgi:hypothetical protein